MKGLSGACRDDTQELFQLSRCEPPYDLLAVGDEEEREGAPDGLVGRNYPVPIRSFRMDAI
jgi:hypothetical protein